MLNLALRGHNYHFIAMMQLFQMYTGISIIEANFTPQNLFLCRIKLIWIKLLYPHQKHQQTASIFTFRLLVFQHCIHRRNVLHSCKHNLKPGAIVLLLAQLCNRHFCCLLMHFWAATVVLENVTTFSLTRKQVLVLCRQQMLELHISI